ncbi:MAG: hypothetical protein ABT940_03190 [Alphaproteobacteria bacterium]
MTPDPEDRPGSWNRDNPGKFMKIGRDEFLSDDPDDEEEHRRGRRGPLGILLGLLIGLGVAGGIGWYAFERFVPKSASKGPEIPLIKAEGEPVKVKPDNPGGMAVPNRDKLIYQQFGENTLPAEEERLLPAAETPLPPPVAEPKPVAPPVSPPPPAQTQVPPPTQPAPVAQPAPGDSPSGASAFPRGKRNTATRRSERRFRIPAPAGRSRFSGFVAPGTAGGGRGPDAAGSHHPRWKPAGRKPRSRRHQPGRLPPRPRRRCRLARSHLRPRRRLRQRLRR